MQVAEGIYRLGTRWVNWYVIEERGALTVLDTGFKGYWEQLPRALEQIERDFTDIKAVILSHYHSDHVGSVNQITRRNDVPVLIHELDLPFITGEKRPKIPNFFPLLRYPTMVRYLTHAGMNGGMATVTVEKASGFREGDLLDVPGGLRVIHTPGHTPGHSSFHCASKNVLLSADALLTTDVRKFSGPPSVMPRQLNSDHGDAVSSLEKLRRFEAPLVLPGHGEPWTGGTEEAVDLALAGV